MKQHEPRQSERARASSRRSKSRHEPLPAEHEAVPRGNWPRSTDQLLNGKLKSTTAGSGITALSKKSLEPFECVSHNPGFEKNPAGSYVDA